MTQNNDKQSFWEHLDVLRGAIMNIAAVTVIFSIIAFAFKEALFAVVLAPKERISLPTAGFPLPKNYYREARCQISTSN